MNSRSVLCTRNPWGFIDTTELLLMQAGDVESNPGPMDDPGFLKDVELYELADGMDNEDFTKVGLALGVPDATLRRYRVDRGNILEATYFMLTTWKKSVLQADARSKLIDTLQDVKLVRLADRLQNGMVSDDLQPLTPKQLQACVADIKAFYRTDMCRIHTDPLDSDSSHDFDQICTGVKLHRKCLRSNEQSELAYEDILSPDGCRGTPTRILVQGEGGAGKTTLCEKMALDWANGKRFQEFQMVLAVPLQYAQDKTVGEIVKTYLSDTNSVQPRQLDLYILRNPGKVFLILDGLDECKDILGIKQEIGDIVYLRRFKSSVVLVTARMWIADQLRLDKAIKKQYSFVTIEGFCESQLISYMRKYFFDKVDDGESLIKFVEENDIIKDYISPRPMFAAMLCTMWSDSREENRKGFRIIKTFAEFFTRMVLWLGDHYISKVVSSDDVEKFNSFRDRLENILPQIGKVALNGLLENRSNFSWNEFDTSGYVVHLGCEMGILTKETRSVGKDAQGRKQLPTTMVQFPHRKFQEYAAGKYLAHLFYTDAEKYKQLIDEKLLSFMFEHRFLLYFTCSFRKRVGVDIIKRIGRLSGGNYGTYGSNLDFERLITSVAFECMDKSTACNIVRRSVLIKEFFVLPDVTTHTLLSYMMTLDPQHIEKLVLGRKTYGPTLSRELADFLLSLRSLRELEIDEVTWNLNFFERLIRKAATALVKVETIQIRRMDLAENAQTSRAFAVFLCQLPSLVNLTIRASKFHEAFYSTMVELLPKIHTLGIMRVDFHGQVNASRDLARAVCKMRCLSNFVTSGPSCEDIFYTTLASQGSTSKVESLTLQDAVISDRQLRSLLCLRNTQSLTLENIDILPAESTGPLSDDLARESRVMELSLDTVTLQSSESGNLTRMFPLVTKCIVTFSCELSNNLIRQLELPGLKELKLQSTPKSGGQCPVTTDTTDLCRVLRESFYALESLTLEKLGIENRQVENMLRTVSKFCNVWQRLSGNEPPWKLRSINFLDCCTDVSLDDLIERFNDRELLRATVQHPKNDFRRIRRRSTSRSGRNVDGGYATISDLEGCVCRDLEGYVPFNPNSYVTIPAQSTGTITLKIDTSGHSDTLGDIAGLCNSLRSCLPQLVKISMAELKLDNAKMKPILQSLSNHERLEQISIEDCGTDEDIDQTVSEISQDRNIEVSVQHSDMSETHIYTPMKKTFPNFVDDDYDVIPERVRNRMPDPVEYVNTLRQIPRNPALNNYQRVPSREQHGGASSLKKAVEEAKAQHKEDKLADSDSDSSDDDYVNVNLVKSELDSRGVLVSKSTE